MAVPEPPSWLDTPFVEGALRQGGDDPGTTVTSLTVKPVGSAGDNFSSAIFRFTVETSSGPRSLIVKVPPRIQAIKELIAAMDYFGTERTMLSGVVPKLEKLLKEAAPERFAAIAARCLHSGDSPEDFIVMEDLAYQGYRLGDRYRGLGLRHSLLAMRSLGRFHGASVALLNRDPTLQKKLRNPLDIQNSPFKVFMAGAFHQAANACRSWKDFPTKYADILESLKDVAHEKYKYIRGFKPGRFNVISHGDFWINNMMFRYENHEVKDIRLVDYQLSNATTPAVDILFFLNSSVSEDVSANHTDMLIREYYTALKETMEVLCLEVPSFGEILNEIQEFGFYSTLGLIGMLPVVKAEKVPDVAEVLETKAEGNSAHFMYTSKSYERWVRRLLPEYHRKGWLSCNPE